jgi:uncharacterized protein (DUF2141 family)
MSVMILILKIVLFLGSQSSEGTLNIEASDFKNDDGKAVIFLYRKEDKIPQKPFKTVNAVIVNGKAKLSFEKLPFQEYAIILLHDKNNNGVIDHAWGFPNEPLGYSNHWKISVFSGMPNFEKLKFNFSENQSIQQINITFKK